MLLSLPGFWLLTGVASEDTIVHMLATGGAERRVVQVHQAERFFHVLFELMKRAKLLGGGGQMFAAGGFEEHLVADVQQRSYIRANQNTGFFDRRLVFSFVADYCANTVFAHLYAAFGKLFRFKTGALQKIHMFGEGWDLRLRAAEEHSLSIKMTMFDPQIRIAAITDEFSPVLAQAIPVMKEIGMTAAELRVVDGKNILDLDDNELKRTKEALDAAGLPVISIASPLLKCVLPNGPEIDGRFQRDAFASKHTFEDQPGLTEHAIAVAQFFGARIVRVFSYWRTVQPELCHDAIIEALGHLAKLGEKEGVIIGLENEHACNVGTAAETARILDFIPNKSLMVVWDPANAMVAGEDPYPGGYSMLPKDRIVHVHAKDCHLEGGKPIWGPLGTRHVRWKEQIQSLIQDGYDGFISLETHWSGPEGNKLEASRICGWNLRGLAAA